MAELDDKVIVTKSKITDIADALREEMSESYEYSLPTMVEKVHELGQGQGSEYTAGVGIDITNRVVSVVDTLMIRGSANGSVASIDDGGNDMPLKSCIVNIEPVQGGSGDPSPSNVRPITGWTECKVTRDGKNLYSNKWSDYTKPAGYRICPVKLEIGKTYTLSCRKLNAVTGCTVAFTKKGDRYSEFGSFDTIINPSGDVSNYMPKTFTVDATYTSPKLAIYCSDETAFNSIFENYEIMLEESSTATDYESYKGNTFNIEFPSQAGTVYGGTLDVTNGVLIINYAYIDMGSCNWTKTTNTYGDYFRSSNTPSLNAHTNAKVYCSQYISKTIWLIRNTNIDKAVACEGIYIECRDSAYTDADVFKTAMNGVQLVYELATPQTYNLTPTEIKTLLGSNNIFADCGDVDVEYVRDATLIINKLLELVSGNNNRTMMKSAVVEKTDEVQEQKKDSVEKASELDA